jgi:tRNA A-37 threonylcarbamoyl transferase component Bud32
MTIENLPASGREEELGAVIFACLQALEAGEAPPELLARYPEFAPELEQFFAGRDGFEQLAVPLRAAVRGLPTVAGAADWTIGERVNPSADWATTSFGDYDLLEEIGRGGMGVVCKARQRSLNRHVALKLLRRDRWAEAADAQRFRNEPEMVAQLDHPHIVPIYEVGEHESRLFFSMKLIDGGSLAEQLGRFPAEPRSAARLVAEVARAVHHAHQRGILHRDLKPSNVLLDHDGQPHVVDFGLAKRIEADASLTQSGALVGTPNYMAPEQTTGQRGAVTTATDVYGLGAVLYVLVTGGPPFKGEDVLATLVQVREREPRPPSRVNRKVDRDLETICLKCLDKEPGRRYGSATEVADDLDRWLAGEPVWARRAGPWERAAKWVRRRPALAGLIAVSALAVLGLVAGLFWHNDQLREAAEREQRQAEKATRQRDAARRAVNDMYTQVAEKWLAGEPGMSDVQREFLEKALRYYEDLAQEELEGPELLLDRAKAIGRMGAILAKLGRRPEAEAAYRHAVAVLEGADVPDKVGALAGWADCARPLVRAGRP